MNEAHVITIDGPSGTGKGTIAGMLAQQLGWHYLDSGALYRVVAFGAFMAGINERDEESLCEFAARMDVQFGTEFEGSIVLNGTELSADIRREETGEKASVIAAIPKLREELLARQFSYRKFPGLIADGRDMGTVVFPDAILKFFLTASPEIRAERRYKQLKNKGVGVNLRGLLDDIRARDERDSKRSVSPLMPAPDAIQIDTSELNVAQVLDLVTAKVSEKLDK